MKKGKVLILHVVIVLSACRFNPSDQKLPILGVRKLIEKIVGGKTIVDTLFKKIPLFQFVNQDSLAVTNRDFDGRIYIADFFFTSCPDVCPIIQRNMLTVYQKYKNNQQVKLLSYTIDPNHDTPSRLKKYATKMGVDGTQWEFLTGQKQAVFALAKNDYMVSVDDDTKGLGGFAHEGYFVLVDKERRMRGVYDGTDIKEVNKLMKDMDILLAEHGQ